MNGSNASTTRPVYPRITLRKFNVDSFTQPVLQPGKCSYKPGDVITATIKVKNSGKYAGKETVQLYISKTGSVVDRADKELKAFKKVSIVADETASVTLNIPVKDLAYYDVKTSKWVVEPGKYKILVGTSSRDIAQTAEVMVE